MSDDAEKLCQCGTFQEAVAVARKLYADTAGTNCMTWALQVAVAMRTLAIEHHVHAGVDRAKLGETCNALTKAARQLAPAAEVHAETIVKRKELYGE